LAAEMRDLVVRWIVFSGAGPREVEARSSAVTFLENIAEKADRGAAVPGRVFSFPGRRYQGLFRSYKNASSIHASAEPIGRATPIRITDWLAELTHNTFRDHLVLEYEIPKYELPTVLGVTCRMGTG
jgi:hypothetical protein